MAIILSILIVLPILFVSGSGVFAGESVLDKNATGSLVVRVQIRLRELGYLNFKPTGSYKSMTVSAVKDFQVNYRDSGYEMQVDGRTGRQSLDLMFRLDAKRSSLSGVSIPAGPKHGSATLLKTGSLTPWSEVKTKLITGKSYKIIDCWTGSEFSLVFSGGVNHAEMEPASEQALEGFKEICGREYNYLKRPVVIDIDGQEIAASIQCWPHGSEQIAANGMEGHVCLFFDGSLSDVGNLPDVEHTENVYKAAGQ